MQFFRKQPAWLRTTTLIYSGLWLAALLALWMDAPIPALLLGSVFLASLPLGVLWIRAARSEPDVTQLDWAILGTALYVPWWQLSVYLASALDLREISSGLETSGLFGLFTIGLMWVVWLLEHVSRQIELARIDQAMQQGVLSAHLGENDVEVFGQKIWNPLDPQAWYYGREGRKLKQSTLAFFAYGLMFWLGTVLVTQIGGCGMEYELPAGGGQQKTVAQTVRIQKVIRKKYVVNPFSAIKFEVPPIDEVKLQLQEVTAHQYVIGYGEGTGAGFAGGTSKGKVRLIRLEYDGGDWDLNYGIGGDHNMLLEYNILTQQKTAEKTEAIRIAQLASFPKEKPRRSFS